MLGRKRGGVRPKVLEKGETEHSRDVSFVHLCWGDQPRGTKMARWVEIDTRRDASARQRQASPRHRGRKCVDLQLMLYNCCYADGTYTYYTLPLLSLVPPPQRLSVVAVFYCTYCTFMCASFCPLACKSLSPCACACAFSHFSEVPDY